MDDDAETTGDGKSLFELARARDFDALEAAWMKRLDPAPHDMEELFGVADYLVRRKFPDRAEILLWSLVTAIAEHGDTETALAVAKRAVRTAGESASLREELIALYRKAYGNLPGLEEGLAASGLAEGAAPPAAIAFVERSIRLRPGAYVLHVRSRRPGRIATFRDGKYVVESEGAEQTLSPRELPEVWELADGDDLRALIVFEKDRLRTLSEEDPAGLVELAVRLYNGRADLKQIRQALVPDVIPADGWTAWWNRVKVDVRRNPRLEASGSKAQPRFELRGQAREYPEKIRTDFQDAADDIARMDVVLNYLNEVAAGHAADPALAMELCDNLIERAAASTDHGVAVALLSGAHEVRRRFPEATDVEGMLAERLNAVVRPERLTKDLKDELARVVLGAIKHVLPEHWPEVFASIFPGASARLCDVIVRELSDANRADLLKAAAEEAVALPDRYADAFVWAWRQSFDERGALPMREDPLALTATMLYVLARLARLPRHAAHREEVRQKLARLRNALAGNGFGLLRGLIASVDLAGARRLYRAIESNEALPEHARLDLVRALEERYPDEFVAKKPLWDDGNIYTTAEGLERRRAQFAKLANEDMPRNARAIGDAAAKGDLRENWEYKAALEERDRLVERAARAREDLERARLIPNGQIGNEEVNIGTRIRVRSLAGGKTREVTFLGPWDADIPRGVYSYQAPVSLRFMGARVGDTVRAILGDEDAEHQIEAIEKVI